MVGVLETVGLKLGKNRIFRSPKWRKSAGLFPSI